MYVISFPNTRKVARSASLKPQPATPLQAALDRRELAAGIAEPLTITLPSEIAKRVRLNAALFSKTPEAFVQHALFGVIGKGPE